MVSSLRAVRPRPGTGTGTGGRRRQVVSRADALQAAGLSLGLGGHRCQQVGDALPVTGALRLRLDASLLVRVQGRVLLSLKWIPL